MISNHFSGCPKCFTVIRRYRYIISKDSKTSIDLRCLLGLSAVKGGGPAFPFAETESTLNFMFDPVVQM